MRLLIGQLTYQGPAETRWLQTRELMSPWYPALGTGWDTTMFSGCHIEAVELDG